MVGGVAAVAFHVNRRVLRRDGEVVIRETVPPKKEAITGRSRWQGHAGIRRIQRIQDSTESTVGQIRTRRSAGSQRTCSRKSRSIDHAGSRESCSHQQRVQQRRFAAVTSDNQRVKQLPVVSEGID